MLAAATEEQATRRPFLVHDSLEIQAPHKNRIDPDAPTDETRELELLEAERLEESGGCEAAPGRHEEATATSEVGGSVKS